MNGYSNTRRLLHSLPATVGELAVVLRTTPKIINAMLCNLREQGKVERTDRIVKRASGKGRHPSLWDRA